MKDIRGAMISVFGSLASSPAFAQGSTLDHYIIPQRGFFFAPLIKLVILAAILAFVIWSFYCLAKAIVQATKRHRRYSTNRDFFHGHNPLLAFWWKGSRKTK